MYNEASEGHSNSHPYSENERISSFPPRSEKHGKRRRFFKKRDQRSGSFLVIHIILYTFLSIVVTIVISSIYF